MNVFILLLAFSFALETNVMAETALYCSQPSASKRFCAADLDKDSRLSAKEFENAFPDINQNAFPMLDSNKDGILDGQEWDAFLGHHEGSMMKGSAMPPRGQATPKGNDQEHQPLIMPPREAAPHN